MSSSTTVPLRPRAFWSDTRFLLGIALIVVAIVGVWFVVAAARQTVPVFAASRTIVAGEPLSSGDLRVVEVSLGAAAQMYATPAAFASGSVATRTISEGELVPAASLAPAEAVRTTTVVVPSTTEIPAAVRTGSTVELWAAAQAERGVFDTPRILVSRATVVAVAEERSMIGTSGTNVELVIERADVAATLAALADGSRLSIVPVAGADR